MKHLFCTYEISLKLKELGFNEPCFGLYHGEEFWLDYEFLNDIEIEHSINSEMVDGYVAAPLYQQAIQFLFDRLEFYYPQIEIVLNSDGSGCWRQDKDCYQETRLTNKVDTSFDTLEEAIVKAIEVLKTTE